MVDGQTGIACAVAAVQEQGGQSELARRVGVTQQAVNKWLRRGWVPAMRAVEVEQATGIPRQRLVNPRLRELVGSDDSGV
jgi:DNA-binding transcriptional regulator YdaS (Cro superfamily)